MRAVALACLAYAATADPDVDQINSHGKAMSKAVFLGGSALPARDAPANPSGAAVPQAPANPGGVAAWNGLGEIQARIDKLHVQNAAMKTELERMESQVETLEGPEAANAQNQQVSGKLFMGFGAFALGGAFMYFIMQKLFPGSQNRHDSRVAPMLSMSTPTGAYMQQASFKPTQIVDDFTNWDPMNLAESQSSEAQAQHIAVEHGRAVMASIAGNQLQEKHAAEKTALKKQGFDLSAVGSATALATAISPTPAFAAEYIEYSGLISVAIVIFMTITATAIMVVWEGKLQEEEANM